MFERKNGKNAHPLVGGCGVDQKPVESSERREKRRPAPWARKGAGGHGYVYVKLAFMMSTGRDEIRLERVLNRDMSMIVCVQPE